MTSKANSQNEPLNKADDFLTGRHYVWSVITIGVVTAMLVFCALYDLFFDPVMTQRGWIGASAGILGGVIGGFVFVVSKIVDHETLMLNDVGRGQAKKEHAAYLRSRLMLAVPSGFVMSTLATAFLHAPSPALLTSFGILGGFSCTLLPSLAHAVETAATRYAAGTVGTKETRRQSRDNQLDRDPPKPSL